MNTRYSFQRQSGAALIVSIFVALLMLVIGASLLRGNNLIEKIVGNTREKQRALQSAQDALMYGEYWLTTATSASLTAVSASACTGAAVSALQVCPSTNLATPSNFSTLALFNYSPPGITFGSTPTAGGLVNTSQLSDVKYSRTPGIYIAYMGVISGTTTPVYQVTAVGYGGNNTTTAIVQSTFKLGSPGITPPPILSGY